MNLRHRSSFILLLTLLSLMLLSPAASAQLPDWAIGPFTRPVYSHLDASTDAPILKPNPQAVFHDPILDREVHWQALHTFNPAAIVRHGQVYVLFRAEDESGSMQIGMHTSRLGLAVSRDGLHFRSLPAPVFTPAPDAQQSREWPGGVEDPRLIQAPDGRYILTYTQWNRQTYTIGVAASRDLRHWTKYGPALGTAGPYANLMYKSGGILTRLHHGHLVAVRLHGHFWMYWGEIHIRLAWSNDLIHWTPVEESPVEEFSTQAATQSAGDSVVRTGHALVLLNDRPGHFDSGFPEVGPPPILTRHGIVLLYNGKNGATTISLSSPIANSNPPLRPVLAPGAYSVGEALFSAANPAHLLARLDEPVLFPQQTWERSGQYTAGTTFAEGLVLFHHHWFLYYGAAVSFVAVAIAPRQPSRP